MDKTAHILKNGKCSKCKYRIARTWKENPNMIYYAMNIVRGSKKVFGICGNCKSEIILPHTMFTKYVIRKTGGNNEIVNQSNRPES